VLLERASQYWGRSGVELERVEFVGSSDPKPLLRLIALGKLMHIQCSL